MKVRQANSGLLSQDLPWGGREFTLLLQTLRFALEGSFIEGRLEMYGSWTCVLSVAILRVSKLYLALWDFYRVFLDRPHIRLLYFKSNRDNIELLIFHVQGLLHVYSLKTKLLLTVNEVLKGIKAFKICLKSSVFGSFLKLKEFLNPLLLCSKASCQHIDHRNS